MEQYTVTLLKLVQCLEVVLYSEKRTTIFWKPASENEKPASSKPPTRESTHNQNGLLALAKMREFAARIECISERTLFLARIPGLQKRLVCSSLIHSGGESDGPRASYPTQPSFPFHLWQFLCGSRTIDLRCSRQTPVQCHHRLPHRSTQQHPHRLPHRSTQQHPHAHLVRLRRCWSSDPRRRWQPQRQARSVHCERPRTPFSHQVFQCLCPRCRYCHILTPRKTQTSRQRGLRADFLSSWHRRRAYPRSQAHSQHLPRIQLRLQLCLYQSNSHSPMIYALTASRTWCMVWR